MKSPVVLAAIAVVLLACSTASAGWPYAAPVVVAPPPAMVHSFYPVGPVYAYPAPVVRVAPRVVYRAPVVYPAPVVYQPRVVYRAPVVYGPHVVYRAPVAYPAPVVIRSKVYVLGRPVRNLVRAVLP